MDTPGTTRSGQDAKVVGSLYVAFELGDRSWKLCLGDGVRSRAGVRWLPAIPRQS